MKFLVFFLDAAAKLQRIMVTIYLILLHQIRPSYQLLPPLQSTWDCNLGHSMYNKQRKLLAVNGFHLFPHWHSINDYQKKITPPIHHLEAPQEGVHFDFRPAFEMMTKRLIEAAEPG